MSMNPQTLLQYLPDKWKKWGEGHEKAELWKNSHKRQINPTTTEEVSQLFRVSHEGSKKGGGREGGGDNLAFV